MARRSSSQTSYSTLDFNGSIAHNLGFSFAGYHVGVPAVVRSSALLSLERPPTFSCTCPELYYSGPVFDLLDVVDFYLSIHSGSSA